MNSTISNICQRRMGYLLCLAAALTYPNYSQADRIRETFVVFDATLYSSKPDLTRYGIKNIDVVYEGHVYAKDDDTRELPTQSQVQRSIERLTTIDPPVVLDFEGWPIQGHYSSPSLMRSNIERYRALLAMYKRGATQRRFGFFGVVPPANFTASIAPSDDRRFQHWQEDTQRLLPLANDIDVAFPEAYTYTDNRTEWLNSFRVHLTELKKIYSGPIYVFIWPQYFDHAPATESLRLKYIPADFWRFQLEQLSQLVDGAIIWGGWDFVKREPSKWNEKAEWWLETKSFLSRYDNLSSDTTH